MTEASVPAPLIVALGEAMLRLTPPGCSPLAAAPTLGVNVAGAELNLLIAASALGARGRWLTRLPANELGTMIRRHALSYGLEVEAIEEPGGRAGLFFLERGVAPRPSSVLYDRAGSAASHLSTDDFDWDRALAGASAAHVTGITCALGAGPLGAVVSFLQAARRLGVTTSFDVNYRTQLWGADEARVALRSVLAFVDVLFVSPGDLALLANRDDETEVLVQALRREFDVATMVLRERREVAYDQLAVSVIVVGDAASEASASGQVVDELGAGDAAAGAFLASFLRGESNAVASQYCARAYARALTIPGDSWSGSLRDLGDGYLAGRKLLR